MKQRHRDACARRADGVTNRTAAPVNVESLVGNLEIFSRRHRDDRKGLVDLPIINVRAREACALEGLLRGTDRGGREPLGLLRYRPLGDDPCHRLEAEIGACAPCERRDTKQRQTWPNPVLAAKTQ